MQLSFGAPDGKARTNKLAFCKEADRNNRKFSIRLSFAIVSLGSFLDHSNAATPSIQRAVYGVEAGFITAAGTALALQERIRRLFSETMLNARVMTALGGRTMIAPQ